MLMEQLLKSSNDTQRSRNPQDIFPSGLSVTTVLKYIAIFFFFFRVLPQMFLNFTV